MDQLKLLKELLDEREARFPKMKFPEKRRVMRDARRRHRESGELSGADIGFLLGGSAADFHAKQARAEQNVATKQPAQAQASPRPFAVKEWGTR